MWSCLAAVSVLVWETLALFNPIIRCPQFGWIVGLLGYLVVLIDRPQTWPVQHLAPCTLLCFIRVIACAVKVNYALLEPLSLCQILNRYFPCTLNTLCMTSLYKSCGWDDRSCWLIWFLIPIRYSTYFPIYGEFYIVFWTWEYVRNTVCVFCCCNEV